MRKFLTDFFSWQSLLSQVVGSVLIAIATRVILWFFDVPVRDKLYWFVLPFCTLILLGVLGALFRQRSRFDRPDFKIRFDGVNLHKYSAKPDSTSFVLVISIRNSGMPSIAEDWALSMILPNGERKLAENHVLPPTLTLTGDAGTIVYSGKDALYNKTVDTPIPTGGRATGVLWSVFESIDVSIASQPGRELILSCKDVLGKEHIESYKLSAISMSPKYLPGTQYIKPEPPEPPKSARRRSK